MCRVGGKSKAVESVVATCGYPPVAPRTFVSRNRRKLYIYIYTSRGEIAGLVNELRRERYRFAVSHADGSNDVAADPIPREDRLVG